ncbi:MAG: GNAT family N-acetyltransferase [Alphaproteobacteria bacterium]|nr:GNAT family N-acetyltransferase [Alphaproteobacteria bacterium]
MSLRTREDGHFVSDDRKRIDRDRVYGWLSREAYWSLGLPRAVFERALEGSMCFGVYAPDGAQRGFARVLGDRATYGYLADVFVDAAFRGRGLSRFMLDAIFAHPELQGFRRWHLATRDAHGLYRDYGFTALAEPARVMERADPDIYRRRAATEN